jgi:hypothetical protein
MRYLKPDIIKRFRSLDDDVADKASEEWEAALEAYDIYLRGITPSMPTNMRRAIRPLRMLHDSRVAGVRLYPGTPRVTLTVETREGELELAYTAVSEDLSRSASFTRHDIGSTGGEVGILYHELGRDRGAFTHSILFTDGSELRLRIRDLLVRRLGRVESVPFEKWRDQLAGAAS